MGYVFALSAALLFGLNGSVSKVIIESGVTAIQLTQFRVVGAALISGILIFFWHKESLVLKRSKWPIVLLLGVVGVGFLQATYAYAIELLPVGVALLLEYLAVPLVALVAFFVLREQVHFRLWLAVGCIIAGLAVVGEVWGSTLNPIGVLWGLGAAASLATYFLFGERELRKTSPLNLSFWTMTTASIFWAPFSGWWNLEGDALLLEASLGGNLASYAMPVWVLILWNITLGSFAPFLLSLSALKRLSATALGVVATSEIIFAFIFAWLWLGEELSPFRTFGAVVVFVGIVLAQTSRDSKGVKRDHPKNGD